MPAGLSKYKNLKTYSPHGDLGMKDDVSLMNLFPHKISGPQGEWRSSKLIPAKPLKYMVGAPAMQANAATPALGGKMPKKPSVAWKAVISGDETMTGYIKPMQMANVSGVSTPANQSPSKFAAKVGVHAGGNQGVNLGTNNGSESKFGMKNYRVSNLTGTPGPSARTSKWAAKVGVHAGGNQKIKADKSTAANASVWPLRNYEMIEAAPYKKAKGGKASRKVR
jgi:hypothetical protein